MKLPCYAFIFINVNGWSAGECLGGRILSHEKTPIVAIS